MYSKALLESTQPHDNIPTRAAAARGIAAVFLRALLDRSVPSQMDAFLRSMVRQCTTVTLIPLGRPGAAFTVSFGEFLDSANLRALIQPKRGWKEVKFAIDSTTCEPDSVEIHAEVCLDASDDLNSKQEMEFSLQINFAKGSPTVVTCSISYDEELAHSYA